MPPTNRKRCGGSIPPKVLSSLPGNLIDDILMRLSLRDAVRTNILSKNWRYKWCRLPELKLDQTLWETTNDLQSSTIRFTYIMYHLLALQIGPITKFTLSIANLKDCPKFDSLICFLSRNGIEHLVLQLRKDSPYKVRFLALAGSGDITAKLSSPLNCLKCLCLSMICLDKFAELSYALYLIRSSPFLQDIQIQVCADVDNIYDDTEIPENFSDVTLNRLRVVKLEGIVGKKIEMELIKLLLAKSPMLERMLIEPGMGDRFPERILHVVTVITKFRRSSPKAEVDYKVDGDSV